MSKRLSEKGLSWAYGPDAGVPASAGSGHTAAEAGTPGARSGVSGQPACRVTNANHLFRQSLNGTYDPVEARFTCGSMVLLFFVHKKFTQ
jgi:hypothetical protein